MNAHGAVLTAAYNLLKGNISGCKVYKIDAPESEKGNYIVLRLEGGSGLNNKRSINDQVILITDVVTTFENQIDSSIVDKADAAVFDILMPTPQSNVLDGAGIQVLNVSRESFNYIQEQDTMKQYYRKVSRYSIRLHQTS